MAEEVADLDARIAAVGRERESGARKADDLLSQLKHLKSLKEKAGLTEAEVRKAMEFTCYSSLSYCCNLGDEGKPCFNRDSVLEAIGLSPEDFVKLKKDFTERIIADVLKKKDAQRFKY